MGAPKSFRKTSGLIEDGKGGISSKERVLSEAEKLRRRETRQSPVKAETMPWRSTVDVDAAEEMGS